MNEAKSLLNSFFSSFLDLLYPRKCPLCRYVSEVVPCEMCRRNLVVANVQLLAPVPFIDEVRAAYVYESDAAAELVKAYKYQRETVLEQFMSERVFDMYSDWIPIEDAIVPVPIHQTRLASRGFNQAEGLCSLLPSHLTQGHLMRIRSTVPQVSLTAEERARNLIGAFQCEADLTGHRILLVDDVFTTGATASECARALKGAGATWVGVLCFAAKPN
jgi:ComF family protein